LIGTKPVLKGNGGKSEMKFSIIKEVILISREKEFAFMVNSMDFSFCFKSLYSLTAGLIMTIGGVAGALVHFTYSLIRKLPDLKVPDTGTQQQGKDLDVCGLRWWYCFAASNMSLVDSHFVIMPDI
jgi:hypothetical protein